MEQIKSFEELDINYEYDSSRSFVYAAFFNKILPHCNNYSRFGGVFSGEKLVQCAEGLQDFIKENRGTMQLAIIPVFDEKDKEAFSISVTNRHPLKRLPNLDNNKLTDINKPIFDYMKSKKNSDIKFVIQNSESEADILLRQINNKKKSYFLQQKLINLHTLAINEKYTLIFGCVFLFLIGASIGTIIRRGGIGLPLVLSISIFLTYHYIGV